MSERSYSCIAFNRRSSVFLSTYYKTKKLNRHTKTKEWTSADTRDNKKADVLIFVTFLRGGVWGEKRLKVVVVKNCFSAIRKSVRLSTCNSDRTHYNHHRQSPHKKDTEIS